MKELQTEVSETVVGIQIIKISRWCSCRVGNLVIPRKIESEEKREKIWHIESLRNNNFTWEEMNLQNTSKGILRELQDIRKEYDLARKYNNQTRELRNKTIVNFITVVSTAGIVGGILALTAMIAIIAKCNKMKKAKEGKKLIGKVTEDILTINLE